MLRSTHKPSGNAPPPLPPGWTEHKAPTGHTYYFNTATQESTYKRPGLLETPAPPPPPFAPANPNTSFLQHAAIPNLSNPAAANAWQAQFNAPPQQDHQQHRGGFGGRGGRHGGGDRPRPQPYDKPKSKTPIPGCEPWVLVYTKYGRRFVYNPTKKASYWRIPEKVMKGIIELDIKGIQGKATGDKGGSAEPAAESKEGDAEMAEAPAEEEEQEIGSDYEEVEVTDSEGEHDDEDGEHPHKRQRTEEAEEEKGPVEFSEEDFAAQLQAMGADYGLDPGEYDDGDPEAWPEGAEGLEISESDSRELFKDLLVDHGLNPFSPWEKLIDEGSSLVDDPRWTVLPNMKARREVWEEWSRAQIQVAKERRAKEEKKDPRIPYLAFLQAKASPKLYWAEFRRKHRKEPPLRDTNLSDKDREKLYRDYVGRLKLPLETQKKDLSALLRSVPLKDLHNKTPPESLPSQLLADIRYVGLQPSVRDPLVKTYIATLGPPPEEGEAADDEATRKERAERRKREEALRERERAVEEQKRRQRRQLEHGRAVLREEERELERAQRVDGRKGIQSQLLAEREKKGADPVADSGGRGDGDGA
ncbi:Pre-mRNA-splicing factor dre4 [Apiospora kogelbergensis]|uniref:Pre-mRNA-splicing factor dre4 n=1 Tax=Apiospora kogelbergensis TaxID=1337665 RepID=UPI00312E6A1E